MVLGVGRDVLAGPYPIIAAEHVDRRSEGERAECGPTIGLVVRERVHIVPVLRGEIFDAGPNTLVGVSGKRVKAGCLVRSARVGKRGVALAELAAVAPDRQRYVLDRIDADSSLKIDRVGAAR